MKTGPKISLGTADLVDISIIQLMAYIWQSHWLRERDRSHMLLVGHLGITMSDLLKLVSTETLRYSYISVGYYETLNVGNALAMLRLSPGPQPLSKF